MHACSIGWSCKFIVYYFLISLGAHFSTPQLWVSQLISLIHIIYSLYWWTTRVRVHHNLGPCAELRSHIFSYHTCVVIVKRQNFVVFFIESGYRVSNPRCLLCVKYVMVCQLGPINTLCIFRTLPLKLASSYTQAFLIQFKTQLFNMMVKSLLHWGPLLLNNWKYCDFSMVIHT